MKPAQIFEIKMAKADKNSFDSEHLNFGFVSNFDIRISN